MRHHSTIPTSLLECGIYYERGLAVSQLAYVFSFVLFLLLDCLVVMVLVSFLLPHFLSVAFWRQGRAGLDWTGTGRAGIFGPRLHHVNYVFLFFSFLLSPSLLFSFPFSSFAARGCRTAGANCERRLRLTALWAGTDIAWRMAQGVSLRWGDEEDGLLAARGAVRCVLLLC